MRTYATNTKVESYLVLIVREKFGVLKYTGKGLIHDGKNKNE